jgi:endonuclease/exonuclease/phosphatase family metal-dependent hydrolase
MKKRGFPYVARSPPAGIFAMEVIDAGILFFSKLPILMEEYLQFDLTTGTEEWMGKGSLYARVQTGPGTHVHFFAVSTQPTHAKSPEDSRTVRFYQWRVMRAQIDRRASDGQPIIILGDLNSDALAPEVQDWKWMNEYAKLIETISKPSYRVVDTLVESLGEHVPTYGVADQRLTPAEFAGTKQRLDYIFVLSREDGEYTMTGQNSETVAFEVQNPRFSNLSSHYGITADILFSRMEGAVP